MITPLPTPPSRQDPSNFAARADDFLGALPTFTTEANALATDVNNKQETATNAANTATIQAGIATTQAETATIQAGIAVSAASTAINAPGTNATSTSSMTIGTGLKTITVQTGKEFVVGQPVMIARTSAPAAFWMSGNITSYNSGNGELITDIVWTNGTGTFTDWTIGLSGPSNPNVVAKSGGTMTGTLVAPDITVTGTLDWDETVNVISGNTVAVKSNTYILTDSLTLTLPASPSAGDWVKLQNSSTVTTITIARNGSNIMSLAENLTIDALYVTVRLVYADAARGWVFG